MAAEAGLGEVAVGDGAVDADIGKSTGAPFGEGDGPAVPARGVFSTMAVPHALLLAAGWRGGTGVLLDRAVEHLPASHRLLSGSARSCARASGAAARELGIR